MAVTVSLAAGFIGGLVAWFFSNYVGRPLVHFYELRSETHTFLFYYANIKFDRPPNSSNAEDASRCFRWLASRLDALRSSTLRPVLCFLKWRRYNLDAGAYGLTGLSNTLAADREGDAAKFRVQAQLALKLPVDPGDQQRVDDESLLKSVTVGDLSV
ncbi:MAG: hypothetical protein WB611_32845 [Stellaceae bacterium]